MHKNAGMRRTGARVREAAGLARTAFATTALARAALATAAFTLAAQAQFVEPDVRVLATVHAVQQGEFFGFVANRVADLTGDGIPDLLVGAPYADAGAGRVYLVSGATGQIVQIFYGQPGEYLGAAVNDAGDVNNDGVHDIVLGGYGRPFSGPTGLPGRVVVYSGATFQQLWARSGEAVNDFLGYVVAGLNGDANGDGVNDVLAGAIGQDGGALNAGAVYILSGVDGATIRRIDSATAGARLGSAIASTADYDGDGVRDVLAGAYRLGGVGRALVFSSATGALLHELVPNSTTAAGFGWLFCDSLRDVDGDGVEDLYVTDFSDAALGAGTGKAYILSGATGAVIRSWTGEHAGDGFGIGRSAGDVDGDGRGDLFVAAYTYGAAPAAVGKGYVLSGANGRVLQTMTGTVAGAMLGYDAGTLGDVDGDGRTDFFITGTGDDPAAVARGDGIVYILAGNPRMTGDMNCDGAVNFDDINPFVLALTDPAAYGVQYPNCDILNGDCNGDGRVDFGDINPFVARLGGSRP